MTSVVTAIAGTSPLPLSKSNIAFSSVIVRVWPSNVNGPVKLVSSGGMLGTNATAIDSWSITSKVAVKSSVSGPPNASGTSAWPVMFPSTSASAVSTTPTR